MRMRFYEKLIILCVLFIGITIATASIIGNYVSIQKAREQEQETKLILD